MTSNQPLDTELDTRSSDIPCFSAGHTKHEWTSWACMEVLFPYLEEEYRYFLESKGKVAESSKEDRKDVTEKSEEAEKDGTEENVEPVEKEEKEENVEKDEIKDEKREDL